MPKATYCIELNSAYVLDYSKTVCCLEQFAKICQESIMAQWNVSLTISLMEQTFFYKNLSKQDEKLFSDYIIKKLPKLESLLQNFSQDSHTLRISIERFDKHNAYTVDLCLNLPTKPLVSQEASHTINKAVDFALDRLVLQVKKHLGQLRKEREHRTIRKEEVMVSQLEEVI